VPRGIGEAQGPSCGGENLELGPVEGPLEMQEDT